MTEVNMGDVEEYQKKSLGRFYYKTLEAYGSKADKMILAMFGQMLEMTPMTKNGKTLLDFVKGDINEKSHHKVVAIVGQSGAGKTATIVDLARQHFVVYCVCSDPRSMNNLDFTDTNFAFLAKEVEAMVNNIRKPDTLEEVKDNDTLLKQFAGERVEIEFLARLLFLQLLFKMKPELTSEQFFREQIGGAITIAKLVGKVRQYDAVTIHTMLICLQEDLTKHIYSKNQGLVIALDEAHIAVNNILAGKLISPSALLGNKKILNRKNELKKKYQRGFLTPLCATLSNLHATLVVLGTSLSLSNADHVYTSVSKPTNFEKITSFPSINEQNVDNLLKKAIDLSDCEISPAKRRRLTGRPRFSANVISQLMEKNDSDTVTKQEVLDYAVDSAIDQAKDDLKSITCDLLTNDKTDNMLAHLLSRMVLAYKLRNGKISFAHTKESDFVVNALCSMHTDSDGMHLIMDEPLVIEVVEKELKRRNVNPVKYLDQLNQVIENLGPDTTVKGNMLELLIRRCLQRFNGFDLTNLPFLKGFKALPTWCKGLKLQIDEVNTANGFGYKGHGLEADLEFLKDRPANKMLIEHSGIRQDGTWFFSNKQYAGSIGIKLYSEFLKENIHTENETSTDIRSSFLKKDGTSNPSLQRIREDFEASNVPSDLKGILRIHLEFPGVKGSKLKTSVKRDPKYPGVEDVMVYIDCSNMDEFFYDGIHENQNDVYILKSIIRYVTTKSREVTCSM
jgi:guanylate kinase